MIGSFSSTFTLMVAMKPLRYLTKALPRPRPKEPDHFSSEFQKLLQGVVNNAKLPEIEKLKAIYGFMDQYAGYVASFSVCQKGCRACCKIPVTISRLEAEYIHLMARIPINEVGTGRQAALGESCPLLSEAGECSVYPFRPFNCRTFHTLDDPRYCDTPGEIHQVYGSPSRGYDNKKYALLARWLKQTQELYELGPYQDIRSWFCIENGGGSASGSARDVSSQQGVLKGILGRVLRRGR